jgi:hypothetical protein
VRGRLVISTHGIAHAAREFLEGLLPLFVWHVFILSLGGNA